MAFEFAFLDWLQQFAHPVMDALAVFFNWAGMHGELWILFGVILLLRRSTRKAGLAMLLALLFYLLVGDMILKPLFARPRPCDLNTLIQSLQWSGPTATRSRPDTPARPLQPQPPCFAKTSAWASPLWCWLHLLVLPACTCTSTSPPTYWRASCWGLCWALPHRLW